MSKKTKKPVETKGERITKFLKEQFKLTVIMLNDEFGLVEERKCLIHLCDKFFETPDGCDANFIKGDKVCKGCGTAIPNEYRCVDAILKLQL